MVDHHPGVQGDHVLGRDQQRINVHLLDLRIIGDQVGEPHEDFDQPVDVHRGLAAVAVQQRPRLERFEHPAGQGLVQRRQGQRPVLKTSAATPPMPTRITAPKIGSFFMPMISSKALGTATIFWMVTPRIVASGRFCLGPLDHLREGAGHGLVGSQVQRHAAHVGLVRDLRRVDFHHHRIADLPRQRRPPPPPCGPTCGLVTGIS